MSKKSLLFVCDWGKERESSWSGTDYAIYSRMEKEYNLIDIDTGYRSFYVFYKKVIRYLKLISASKEMIDVQKHFGKKILEKYDSSIPSFQFGNFPYESNRFSFCYQDLSIEYVRQMKILNPSLFDVSGYKELNANDLDKLAEQQRKYYSNNKTICFTMGHWLHDWLINELKIPEERVIYVGGGYNVDSSKINNHSNGKTFLFIGKDAVRKDLKLVLEAFKKIHDKDIETKLIVAGPEKTFSNQDGVLFKGLVPFSQLPELLNSSTVFVMPSLFEAYGLVFPEALTYGLPAIGRNAYEMPYFIDDGKTGYLLNKENADELAFLMHNALINSNLRKNITAKRNFYLKEYSWDTVISRMKVEIEKRI